MDIKNISVKDLIPYERNTKKHDDVQINNVAESIKQYGFVQPIVIDKNNVVVIGHCRLLAAKKLKMADVPCVCVEDLTEEQVKALRIVDNKSNESPWDFDFLADELADLDLSDFSFDFGIDTDAEEETEIVENEAPEVDEENEPIAKLGDIWQLGRHRLMCGDSTDKETVELLMNGSEADFAFQSPPYNIGKNAQLNDRDDDNKYTGYDDDNPEYISLLNATTEHAINNSRYTGINIQMLSGNKVEFVEWLDNFKHKLCDISIWYKDNVAPAMARRVMNSSFEFVVFFSKENQSRAIGTADFRGTMSNVYQSHIQSGNEYSKIHSATFPVAFVSHYISNLTNKNDVVLDLFGGTGTTLIGCEQLDRTCYMMELDPRYVKVILERYIAFKGTSEDVYRINADGTKTKYADIT